MRNLLCVIWSLSDIQCKETYKMGVDMSRKYFYELYNKRG